MNVGGDEAISFFFDIGLRKEELNQRDLTTCEYVEDSVHKIPFDLPWDTPAIHLSNLGAIFQQCYSEVQVDSNSTIVYKGGHIERDLLRQLGIPSVNLEWFGCPKAEKLFLHFGMEADVRQSQGAQRVPSLCKGRS